MRRRSSWQEPLSAPVSQGLLLALLTGVSLLGGVLWMVWGAK